MPWLFAYRCYTLVGIVDSSLSTYALNMRPQLHLLIILNPRNTTLNIVAIVTYYLVSSNAMTILWYISLFTNKSEI